MRKIFSTISCNADYGILSAALPLLEEEHVEAIEWSFDTLYKTDFLPAWFEDLLGIYSRQGRLIGHGVFFSIFSGKWLPEQQCWLKQLEQFCKQFNFDHITEHFGYMTGSDFHKGAPIAVPLNSGTLHIGKDRLKRIQDACNCPVGLENLAFAFTHDDVKKQGAFLAELVNSVNGFIILDLHNIYCQTHNFNTGFKQLLELYPLEKVREIHISGGSWEPFSVNPRVQVRRDTHDDVVPEIVFDYLQQAIPLCPNLKFVTLEQIGSGLATEHQRSQYRKDYIRMAQIISKSIFNTTGTAANDFSVLFNHNTGHIAPLEDMQLHSQQQQLTYILENAASLAEAKKNLQASALASSDWKIENWTDTMLETALKIAQKWKFGFV